MATYDTSTGLRALQGGSLVSEIDTGFLALAQDVAARLPTVVTSLPGAPYDGQEIYYVADATNGIVWHLRYRSASASAYKWEFVGGSPMRDEVSTLGSTASAAFVDLASTGPQLTAPLAGDYEVDFGAKSVGTGGIDAIMSIKNGGAATSDVGRILVTGSSGATSTQTRRMTVTAAATALKAQYRAQGGTAQFLDRWMRIVPVRVG